ncbi:hypothetical protein DSM107133_03868 (plasmid) [Pseudosulfitobacter sp. DSM 107133]|nr:hypothetical protein DSM107133_03868 [Pseudosulfitobacter sp. DSM 107133]
MGAVYKQLSITERRKIERWRYAKVPVDEMARVLKRCRSTIFRELKRNHFADESMPGCDGYYGAAAHLMQAERRTRERKLIKHHELRKRVIEGARYLEVRLLLCLSLRQRRFSLRAEGQVRSGAPLGLQDLDFPDAT